MTKKWHYFLFVLLLIVPLALAACGGDDDNGDDNGNGDAAALNQTFESEFGLTFKYPDGWAAMEEFEQVYLANSQDVLDKMQSGDASEAAPAEGEVGFVISAVPVAELGMDAEDASLDDVFGMLVGLMTGEGMTTRGEVETITIGDTDARIQRVTENESNSDGFFIAFLQNDNIVLTIGIAAEGQADQYESVLMNIAETIVFTPPAEDAE